MLRFSDELTLQELWKMWAQTEWSKNRDPNKWAIADHQYWTYSLWPLSKHICHKHQNIHSQTKTSHTLFQKVTFGKQKPYLQRVNQGDQGPEQRPKTQLSDQNDSM